MVPKKRLIVGISGASGVVYGVRLLQILQKTGVETHLVMTKAAEMTLAYETDFRPADITALADVRYAPADMGAPVSSGSFRTEGMIIAPCSVRTVAEIATSVTSSLLTRAADVTLKERRKLVLMVRESPLHTGHLETMARAASIGAIIAPPVPAFYTKPESIEDIVDQTVARSLDLVGIDTPELKRWGEDIEVENRSARNRTGEGQGDT